MRDHTGVNRLPFVNNTGETIPKYAVMRPTGGTNIDGEYFLVVAKPDANSNWQPVFNGDADVAHGEYGTCSFGAEPVWVKGSGSVGDLLYPQNNSWTMSNTLPSDVMKTLYRIVIASGSYSFVVWDPYLAAGCGTQISSGSISIDRNNLYGASSGLEDGGGTCDFQVKVYCGLQLDSNGVWVDRDDLIGDGLTAGSGTCDISVNAGCGLTTVLGVLIFDAATVAGNALSSTGVCGLNVNVDGVTIAINGSNQLYAIPPSAWAGCGISIDSEVISVDIDELVNGENGLENLNNAQGCEYIGVKVGCGIYISEDGEVAIATDELAGDGLTFSGDCLLDVLPGCGLKIDEEDGNSVAVDVEAFATFDEVSGSYTSDIAPSGEGCKLRTVGYSGSVEVIQEITSLTIDEQACTITAVLVELGLNFDNGLLKTVDVL